jgi:hypothetical protein
MIIRIRSIVFSDTCVGAQNVGADYYATRLGIYSCRCGLMSWNSRIPRAIHIFPAGVSIKGSMHERSPFLNARPMRRLGVSRRDLFFELDRPALKPLPGEPMKTPSGGCAGLDYHFDIDGHYYSAPRRAARRPHHGSDRRAVPPGRACRPVWLKIKRGHYTAAKECFDGYRKRHASEEGMRPSFKPA